MKLRGQHRQWACGPCFYCDRPTFRCAGDSEADHKYTRDHVIPRAFLKGKVSATYRPQTVVCCNWCNTHKHAMSVRQFVTKFLPGRVHKIQWELIDRIYVNAMLRILTIGIGKM
jgi:hypothetical protein